LPPLFKDCFKGSYIYDKLSGMGKASRRKKIPNSEVSGNQGRHVKELNVSQKSPIQVRVRKTTSIIKFIPIVILLFASFAVYFKAFWGDFVYDDIDQIVDNPWIRDMRNISTIFSKSVWSFQPGMLTSNYYRPLMHFVYMLNYHLFGLKPWGFHLVNILFHCGVTVLVFLVIRRLLPEQRASVSAAYLSPPFIAAMLFASHPIHTEAVTWIAGLPDVAFTFFYLLSFYLYILFRDGAKGGYLLSILSFLVATLFKEPALTLPIMLIAYDYLMKKLDEPLFASIKRYLPYVVVSGIYLLVRHLALGSFAPSESYPDLSTYQFIINVFPLFRDYIASLLWPFDLNVWHTFHPVSSLFEAKVMISVVVVVLFFIVTMAAYRKNRLLFFSLLLIVVPLLPVFYIKAISGKPFAERYLYLPTVGFVFLVAIFLAWAKEKLPQAANMIKVVFLVIVGLYAFGTITRNNVWLNSFNLWTDTVNKSPDSADVHHNLGIAYASKGQLDRAVAEFQETLRMKPDYVNAHKNLGVAYESQGQLDRAIAEFQETLRMKPNYALPHYCLGHLYAAQGQLDRAVAEYQEALRLNPDSAEAHNNLGTVYRSQGQLDKAVAEYQMALRLNPDYGKAHNNLGVVYVSQGQLDKAIAEYKEALRLNPAYALAHNNLGIVYAAQGQLDRAIAEYKEALRLKPDYYEARQHLTDIVSGRQ
jgi:tetratricopeptide (TPR) repeat protein